MGKHKDTIEVHDAIIAIQENICDMVMRIEEQHAFIETMGMVFEVPMGGYEEVKQFIYSLEWINQMRCED